MGRMRIRVRVRVRVRVSVTSVQDIVHVLHEGLYLDLSVGEQEHRGFAIQSGHFKHTLEVVPPLRHAVDLADLDAIHLGRVRGRLRGRGRGRVRVYRQG